MCHVYRLVINKGFGEISTTCAKLNGRDARDVPEDSAQMMRIFETDSIGDFADRLLGTHDQELDSLDDSHVDMFFGRVPSRLLDQVAEVVRRQRQLLCAIGHCGQTFLDRQIALKIIFEHSIKPVDELVAHLAGRIVLPGVEPHAIAEE